MCCHSDDQQKCCAFENHSRDIVRSVIDFVVREIEEEANICSVSAGAKLHEHNFDTESHESERRVESMTAGKGTSAVATSSTQEIRSGVPAREADADSDADGESLLLNNWDENKLTSKKKKRLRKK